MFTICGSVPVSTQLFFSPNKFMHASFIFVVSIRNDCVCAWCCHKTCRSRSVVAAFSSARANGLPRPQSKILVSHSRVESLLLLSCPDVTLEMTVKTKL